MGNSTISLQDVIDSIAVIGDLSPQANPGGYGPATCLSIANDTMADLISKRFNWKWNSFNVAPFYTNTYQQDYPQIDLANIGWLEAAWWVDINSTQTPKPLDTVLAVKDLEVVNTQGGLPAKVCWMYNRQLLTGAWPGANTTYGAYLNVAQAPQNPPMAIRDVSGNILVVTTVGVTGSVAPDAGANAAAGSTVADGTVTWKVCNPNAQGFRVWPNPPANGPVFQLNVKAQMKALRFTSLTQTIDPIPDDYSQHFKTGFTAYSHKYSKDPDLRNRAPQMLADWQMSMVEATKQGDREPDSFVMYPATSLLSGTPYIRNPRNPARPY